MPLGKHYLPSLIHVGSVEHVECLYLVHELENNPQIVLSELVACLHSLNKTHFAGSDPFIGNHPQTPSVPYIQLISFLYLSQSVIDKQVVPSLIHLSPKV